MTEWVIGSGVYSLGGGVAQWVARLTRDRWILVSREFEPHQRPLLFSLSKKLYSNCLVLVQVPGKDSNVIYINKQNLVSQSN